VRIVSLIPSATEIACALGFEDRLVGRSHSCDYPPSVLQLPALTEPKLDIEVPSADIDARVQQLVRDGLSVYRVDSALLRALEPTLILTQDHCEVCAASLSDVELALADWPSKPAVVSLRPSRLEDVLGDLERVADALGAPERGQWLRSQLQHRLDTIEQRVRAARSRPSVACIEWLDPLMFSGNWVPELVELAGGRSVFGEAGRYSSYLDWTELVQADPEVLILMPCGFGIDRTLREVEPLVRRPEWKELRAVRAGRVFVIDGDQYLNRPGPRLVESAQVLAEILHPEVFAPLLQGRAWQRRCRA
jgi:iron complex transport system substrate-binding protein